MVVISEKATSDVDENLQGKGRNAKSNKCYIL